MLKKKAALKAEGLCRSPLKRRLSGLSCFCRLAGQNENRLKNRLIDSFCVLAILSLLIQSVAHRAPLEGWIYRQARAQLKLVNWEVGKCLMYR